LSILDQDYRVISFIVSKRNVQTLMLIHLTCILGFQTDDSGTLLPLVKWGFTNKAVALLATISFPYEFLRGGLLGMAFRHYHSLEIWRALLPLRLVAIIAQGCVFLIQYYGAATSR
jgi:Acetyl-coenzyme A transporter 1